jgi:glycosyltransferase involved in cell wall biosynthesis
MYTPDFFPPEKLTAEHYRLLFLAKESSKQNETIIICSNNKFSCETSKFDNISIIRIPNVKIALIKSVLPMIIAKYYVKKYLKDNNITIDVLWYNSPRACAIVKKFPAIKIYDIMGIISKELLTERNMYNCIKSYIYKKMEKILYKYSDIITTINEKHKNTLKKYFDKDIYIIRDAVHLNTGYNKKVFRYIKNEYRDNFVIFFVGSFAYRKRLEKIFYSLPVLCAKIPTIKIIYAGEGKFIEYYKERSIQLGIEKNINFIGYIKGKELNSYIKLSDVCISDVFLEGFPYKIFEYMAMGKIALVEDTPAVREVLTDSVNACLYVDGNDFVKKILMIKKNVRFRRKIELQAKKESKNHTWKKRGEQFNVLLKRYHEKTK